MEQKTTGYKVKAPRGYLHIKFYGDRIVRFAYSENQKEPSPTVAVVARPVARDVCLENGVLYTDDLKIEVDKETLAVKISDRNGNVISEDLTLDTKKISIIKKRTWEKGVYGNGEKYTWINQLGTATINYNSDVLLHHSIHNPLVQNMHTSIPFYIGAAPGNAYGVFFDNSYRTEFDFAKTDQEVISFQAHGGHLDYYFIYGPSVSDVVTAYGLLTGTPPLPRKNFLGYHQSRYSYEDQEELLSVAESLRKYQIPCDVLYLDLAYMEAYKVFTINKERFRDFKKVLEQLKEKGFSVVVIVNPGVKVEENYRVYEEGKERGYYVKDLQGQIYQGEVWPKPAAFPDFRRSEVRKWWAGFHRELLECGVEGIWNDMNEPSNFNEEEGTLPDETVHLDDDGKKIPHSEAHNIYGLLQTQATLEGLEKYQPEKRAFILTRAAFAGSQRYSALWTGDNSSTWEHLESSIPMILNLGLSGYSFVGADVGGYRGDCSGELLVRWTQLGAFIPYFRNHSETGTARQEPWEYSPAVLEVTRKYIRLRYQLLTHYYNLMRVSALTGVPAVRPLFYHHQEDLNTYNINDQFLLGEGIMVCPVLRPGMDHRLIYLPEGLWHDYWTGDIYHGSKYYTCKAPLEVLPLYIKAGTIIPHDHLKNPDNTGRIKTGLTMHCYGGKEGYYRLYLDDGVSFNYRQGEYSELEFSMTDDPVKPEINVNTIKKGFPLPVISYKLHAAR